MHFEADFKNGTTYIQGSEDVSLHKAGKNAFYDILQREDEVIKFHIVKVTDSLEEARWSVDLLDGHFEHNGESFHVHDKGIEDQYVTSVGPFKLIYYKVRHEQMVLGSDGSKRALPGYINKYCIGWRTVEQNEKGTQRVIAVG